MWRENWSREEEEEEEGSGEGRAAPPPPATPGHKDPDPYVDVRLRNMIIPDVTFAPHTYS